MKNSKVAIWVVGALVAGLTLGGLGIASAADRASQTTPAHSSNMTTSTVPADGSDATASVPPTGTPANANGNAYAYGRRGMTPRGHMQSNSGQGVYNGNPCPWWGPQSAPTQAPSARGMARSTAVSHGHGMMNSGSNSGSASGSGMMGSRR
jgi:hypothetical protein